METANSKGNSNNKNKNKNTNKDKNGNNNTSSSCNLHTNSDKGLVFLFGFLGAGGRLPKARRGRVSNSVIHHHHQLFLNSLCVTQPDENLGCLGASNPLLRVVCELAACVMGL